MKKEHTAQTYQFFGFKYCLLTWMLNVAHHFGILAKNQYKLNIGIVT